MITARSFRALCCGALAAAGCAKPDDPPAAEMAYGDSALEEYRPYDGIEEFRRDIGEQIGPEEAARLERYIILP